MPKLSATELKAARTMAMADQCVVVGRQPSWLLSQVDVPFLPLDDGQGISLMRARAEGSRAGRLAAKSEKQEKVYPFVIPL